MEESDSPSKLGATGDGMVNESGRIYAFYCCDTEKPGVIEAIIKDNRGLIRGVPGASDIKPLGIDVPPGIIARLVMPSSLEGLLGYPLAKHDGSMDDAISLSYRNHESTDSED